jgi:DNA-binding beta-propeller fold protein YncE
MSPQFRSAVLASALCLAASAAYAQAPAYHVSGHIAGPDGRWDYASFDPASHRVYVAKGDAVMMVEIDSAKVTPVFAAASRSHQVLPLPGDRLLVTNGGNDTAVFLDAKTGKTLGSVSTGKGPDAAIYDPKSGLAFVMAHAGGQVTFIDVATMQVAANVVVGGKAMEYGAVDDKGRLWVNDEDLGEITAIDIATRKVLGHHKMAGCEGPTGLAYAPAADRLVASCDKVAAVIDPATGTMVDKLTVGDGPDAVIYDPARKRLFVTAGESGELDVIDASHAKLKVVQVVKTQVSARTGTVDPGTGKIYLPAAKLGAPAKPGGRGQPIPGTFELTVVAP